MKNVGTLDILTASIVHVSGASKTTSYAQIHNGNNQTLMALYTIPLGKTGYLTKIAASLEGQKKDFVVSARKYHRKYGGVFQLKRTFGLKASGSSQYIDKFEVPLVLTERTDIKIEALTSLNDTSMNCTFDLILIDN